MDTSSRHFFKNITLEQAFVGGNFKVQLQGGRTVKVKLKPGSYSGQTIRLKNKAGDYSSENSEDTLITLHVLDHPMYRVENLNLNALAVISPAEAKLGTLKKLPGPDGRAIHIKIPKNAEQGQHIVLVNRGLRKNDKCGDIIFKIKIEDLSSADFSIETLLRYSSQSENLH